MEVMKISEIRENMRLHGEGMQILAMTVRSVTLFTMESVTEKKEGGIPAVNHKTARKNQQYSFH